MGSDEILKILLRILENREPVKFTNTFHGITVNFTGKALKVLMGRALFRAPREQLVAMRSARYTFIQSDSLSSPVKADVIGMDWYREIAALSDFVYVSNTIGSRMYVRVEPENDIRASISVDATKIIFSGQVIDVSQGGLALNINQNSFNKAKLKVEKQLAVSYELPLQLVDQSAKIDCTAIIKNITPDRYEKYFRLGLQTTLDVVNERLVIKYVAQRQYAILKELKKLSAAEQRNR